ncbi:MAG: signal peptidase I [Gaiellaceae bacterium]
MQQRLGKFATRTAGLVSGLAVLAAVAYAALFVAGYRPVVVYSGSMEPALGVGSLAVVERVPTEDVRAGDVLTFADPTQSGRLVTHRVVEVVRRPEGGLAYWTKGDANTNRDPWTIALPEESGRVAFDVPYVGYALWYAKTREVRTALVLLVASLVLVLLLRAIWRREDEPAEPAQEPAAALPASGDPKAFWIEALTR